MRKGQEFTISVVFSANDALEKLNGMDKTLGNMGQDKMYSMSDLIRPTAQKCVVIHCNNNDVFSKDRKQYVTRRNDL